MNIIGFRVPLYFLGYGIPYIYPRFPRTIVGMVVGKKTVPGTGVSDSRVPCSHVPGGLHPDRIRAYFRRVFNHREVGPARARPSTQSRSLLLRRGAVLRNTKTAPYHLSRRIGPHNMSIETISRRKCSKCRKMHLRANGKSRNSRSREKTVVHAKKRAFTRISRTFHAVSRCFFANIFFEQKAVQMNQRSVKGVNHTKSV